MSVEKSVVEKTAEKATEVFPTAGYYRGFFSARGFFSLLDHQCDILSVLTRLALCPPFLKNSLHFVIHCNYDQCFVHLHLSTSVFVHALHDMSHYEMSNNEISMPQLPPPPPPPPLRKILYLPLIHMAHLKNNSVAHFRKNTLSKENQMNFQRIPININKIATAV